MRQPPGAYPAAPHAGPKDHLIIDLIGVRGDRWRDNDRDLTARRGFGRPNREFAKCAAPNLLKFLGQFPRKGRGTGTKNVAEIFQCRRHAMRRLVENKRCRDRTECLDARPPSG